MVTIGYDYDTLIDPTKGRRTESTTIYISICNIDLSNKTTKNKQFGEVWETQESEGRFLKKSWIGIELLP